MSKFIFRTHKPAEDEDRQYGLVDVYVRETGEHIGMLNPTARDGYVLRNTEGVRLSVAHGDDWSFNDVVPLSRETCASILQTRVKQFAELLARRAVSVTAGCPNKWHNGSSYRETYPCPECPSQPGLKLALAALHHMPAIQDSRADAIETIHALICTPED